MTDFGYPPEYTVGHGSTETPTTAQPTITGVKKYAPGCMPLLDEIPFLPIEQLPEAWKDGRDVFLKTDYLSCPYRVAGFDCFESEDDSEARWLDECGDEITPTHFCPIQLSKEV